MHTLDYIKCLSLASLIKDVCLRSLFSSFLYKSGYKLLKSLKKKISSKVSHTTLKTLSVVHFLAREHEVLLLFH